MLYEVITLCTAGGALRFGAVVADRHDARGGLVAGQGSRYRNGSDSGNQAGGRVSGLLAFRHRVSRIFSGAGDSRPAHRPRNNFV